MSPIFYLACVLVIFISLTNSKATRRKRCHDDEFTCTNRKCISLPYHCDGNDDCHDGSDEVNCTVVSCSAKKFKCISGDGCIHRSGVCNLTVECLDGSDEFNCAGKAPQEKWKEHWLDHRENLTLAHADDNVALYSDSQTNSSITWSFEIVSKAWEYVKKTYWSFEPDPRLFVVLHSQKKALCHMNSYLHKENGHRNIMDCGRPRQSSWNKNTSSNALILLTKFGVITRLGAKGVVQNADFRICQDFLVDVISHDVYTHILGQTAEINAWKELKSSKKTTTFGLYCFRDWFWPIYEKYGGPLVVERFYSLTHLYAKRSASVRFKYFSMAQFIHFWSGAAQADLTSLAYTAFDWFDDDKMKKVREIHPQFSYPVTCPNATSYWNVSNSISISKSEIGRLCKENEFRCQNTKCVPKRYLFDGDDNCGDSSDEVHYNSSCHYSTEFACRQGGCVPLNSFCNSTEECADGSDEFNCAGKKPEVTWAEVWQGHKENLTLAYADDHVVVYYDSHTNRSIEWPFSVLEKAWNYAKATYGPFEPDSRLFVIFHTDMHEGCRTNKFLHTGHGHRNLIDCGLPKGRTWESPSPESKMKLLTMFGHIIRGGAKGFIQDADNAMCADIMREIISYDIYMHIVGDFDGIWPWKNERLREQTKNRYCFKNWFLPIYTKYGGASVLNNFYSLTNLYGNRTHDGINFVRLSMSEFIHFWSGAAQADLTSLAYTAFDWFDDGEMKRVREEHPQFSYPVTSPNATSYFGVWSGKCEFRCQNGNCVRRRYVCDGVNNCGDLSDEFLNCKPPCKPSTEFTCKEGGCIPLRGVCNSTEECADGSDEFNCAGQKPEVTWEEHWHFHNEIVTLAHANDHLVVYYDSDMPRSIEWPFSVLEEAWKYATATYGSFGPDPRLFVILHTHGQCDSNSFLDKSLGRRNVIDCGLTKRRTWESPSPANMKNLLTTFGKIIRGGAKGVIQNADATICNDLMRNILSYDIYIHFREDTEEILPWKNEKLSEHWRGRFCFKNWFLPIYEKYGGASVLNNYYSLTYLYGNRTHDGIDFVGFSMPEFIHFWSGAAHADLTSLAYTAFGWFNNDAMKKVRDRHPQFSYSVTSPNATSYWNVSNAFGISKSRLCKENEFRCQNTKCVPKRYVCNRVNNCGDLSDEVDCRRPRRCSPLNKFTCRDGGCVSLRSVCNSIEQCADGSDEFNCAGKTPQVTWKEHWYDHEENLTLAHADDNIVLYYDSNTNRSIEWPFSVLSEAWKYATVTYGPLGPDPRLFVILHTDNHSGCHTNSLSKFTHGRRNVIDCGLTKGRTWESPSPENKIKLLTMFGRIVRGTAKGVIQNADVDICNDLMSAIISYDIYMHFRGDTEEILPWKNKKLSEHRRRRFCFKNWFLPIYEKYGGASVLNNFYSLTYLHVERIDGFERLSMSEFVHFWSGAAHADLAPLASTLLGWENEDEMILTRRKYPEIRYPLSQVISYKTWKSPELNWHNITSNAKHAK